MEAQLGLLDSPIARRTDPATSHAAADALTRLGRRDTDKALLLSLIRRYPDRTAMELAQIMVDRGIDWFSAYSVASKRVSDLALSNPPAIRESGRRKCGKTGAKARTWKAI